MQGEQRDEVPTPRQRAFQTALFVMLTMMLLDPPADPSRRGVGEAEAAGGDETEDTDALLEHSVDAQLRGVKLVRRAVDIFSAK